MLMAKIDIYSHFFMVTKIHPHFKDVIRRACEELLQVSYVKIRGRVQKQATKVFAASNKDKSEFRFHINYYRRFCDIMRACYMDTNIKIYQHELYEPTNTKKELIVNSNFSTRDYQQNTLDYLTDEGVSKLVTLQTGLGKGYVSMKFGELTGKRIFIVVLARYIEKWRQELIELYGDKLDLYIPEKGKELTRLFMTAKDEYERNVPLKKSKIPDIVLISSNSFQRYLTTWEQANEYEKEALVCPHEIYEYMGIGLKILDEAHQHFHLNFKMDLYQHTPKAVYLTATLESNDVFMQRMYQLMWPLDMRDKVLEYNKYDYVYAYLYRHQHPEKIRCVSSQGYSHIAYEQSIFRHVPSRRQYLDMIGDVVENYFLPEFKPGRKMLIFCSLIETCQIVSEYLLKRFKDQKWKISKFTAEDPKEVIDTNDITVSTLGKSGTALDIPGLIQVLMTVALSEPKANLQAKGRNRNLKSKPGFEDVVPKFIYFVGQDIDKHRQYHHEKMDLFKPRTLMLREIQSKFVIGEPMKEYLRYQGNIDNGF